MSLSSCGPVSGFFFFLFFFLYFFVFFVVSPFSHDHFSGFQERLATTKAIPVIWTVQESESHL